MMPRFPSSSNAVARRRDLRRRVAAVLLPAFVAALAGCGGDGTDDVIVGDLLAAAGAVPLRGEMTVDFDGSEPLGGWLIEGFYPPEIGADGGTFAWADGGSAALRLRLFGSGELWLHLRCRPFVIDPAVPQRMSVSVNGAPIGELELAPEFATYTLPLPATALEAGENRLEFGFTQVGRPSEHRQGSLDARLLSVAFDWLVVTGDPTPPDGPRALYGELLEDRMVQPLGTEWPVPVVVPAGSRLVAGLSAETRRRDLVVGELLVRTEDGAERVVYTARARLGRPERVEVDLAPWSGQRIELTFRAVGEPDSRGRVVWTRPRLLAAAASVAFDRTTDVLLIVVDTLRADVLSAYGGPASTPNIDALAASGVLFRRAYSHAPITGPSHGSMFTSLLPAEHGVHNNTQVLPAAHHTLAELLRAGSRRTAAFVSLGVLAARFGTAQGFDEYHDRFERDWWKTAEQVNREVLPWLERADEQPFFLWVHYSDPHEPYAPPGRHWPRLRLGHDGRDLGLLSLDATTAELELRAPAGRSRLEFSADGAPPAQPVRLHELRVDDERLAVSCGDGCRSQELPTGGRLFTVAPPASLLLDNPTGSTLATGLRLRPEVVTSFAEARQLYREEVEACDREIGRLLDALRAAGRLDRTLVVLTSDHGEGLGDHELMGHVHQLYDSLLRVPLIVSLPGRLPAGRVVEEPVALVDLLPTVTDLLRLPDVAPRAGRSLVPLMLAEGAAERAAIVAETYRPEAREDLQAVVEDGFKLIVRPGGGAAELYDLGGDPGESVDLAGQRPELARSLEESLGRRLAEARRRARTADPGALTEDELERLRALGYVR